MKWIHALIGGSAIILLANGAALLNAGLNRSGAPESQLQLSQREFRNARRNFDKENSGITLTLDWRIEPRREYDQDFEFGYSGRWGMPLWLDREKMIELGFDMARYTSAAYQSRHMDTSSMEVLLVLELNGQAYRHYLERAQEYLENSRARLADEPDSESLVQKAKRAEESFADARDKGSRLFVIDAGHDALKLRAAYPDRSRHAIVAGLIRPTVEKKDGNTWSGGRIDRLHADSINVPFAHRQVFTNPAPHEVVVAFGQRLEPWIVAAFDSDTN